MSRTRQTKPSKKTDDLICHEENDNLDDGFNHQVQCTTDGCEIWTDIWIPKKLPRNFLSKPFLCGFCAAEKLGNLEKTCGELELRKESNSFTPLDQPTYAQILKSIKHEEKEQEQKALNLILYGTKPSEDDESLVTNMMRDMQITPQPKYQTKRIGKINDTGHQLLLLTFEQKNTRNNVLKQAKSLRRLPGYEKVYINPDRTREEQQTDRKLRTELKKTRANDPNNKYIIRNFKIIQITTEK